MLSPAISEILSPVRRELQQVLNASRAAQQQQQQTALTRRLLTEHEELQDRMDELLSLLRSLATPPPVALPAPQPLQLEQLEQLHQLRASLDSGLKVRVRVRVRISVRIRVRVRVHGYG